MYPVLARQVSLPPTSFAETQPDPNAETPEVSASPLISSPIDTFIAQNGAHPILSGETSSQSLRATETAQDSLLREAQAQMSATEALGQKAKDAEAQQKQKVWSMVGAVVPVVVAIVPSASRTELGSVVPDSEANSAPAAMTEAVGSLADDLPKP